MVRKIIIGYLATVAALFATRVDAGVGSKVIQEAVEFAAKKFGREVAEEGVETLAAKMTRFATKHGDEVVAAAFKKVGPRAGRIAGEAGEHSGLALRLLAKHGDEGLTLTVKKTSLLTVAKYGDNAATALIKHGPVGQTLITEFGKHGVEALARITPRNGRRLAMMASDGALKPELLSVVAKYGDAACDFVWRNKGALAVGTTLATFVANPGGFIDGTNHLATTVVESAVKPLAEVPKVVATEAAKNANWTTIIIAAMTIAGVSVAIRIFVRRAHTWQLSSNR
jgi:hypothetical protein